MMQTNRPLGLTSPGYHLTGDACTMIQKKLSFIYLTKLSSHIPLFRFCNNFWYFRLTWMALLVKIFLLILLAVSKMEWQWWDDGNSTNCGDDVCDTNRGDDDNGSNSGDDGYSTNSSPNCHYDYTGPQDGKIMMVMRMIIVEIEAMKKMMVK